ncbi:MAG TPA: hypothetical protein VL651_12955 [Bacteroidia bacterium]|nr:hypothetical protein [Bacteroidia bacterium]
MKRTVFLFFGFYFSCAFVNAQQFENSSLEAAPVSGGSFDMRGWSRVPYDDPHCDATDASFATPDIIGVGEPDKDFGINGRPHSGRTSVSGIDGAGDGSDFYQEGIMQEVHDLIPGQEYRITFYQSVVKQKNCLDTTGCWGVYIDDDLAGISEPSLSKLPYDAENLIWDERTIYFTATRKSHWIKFLPVDDDHLYGSMTDEINGLRMGIDDITLAPGKPIAMTMIEGPVKAVLVIENKSDSLLTVHVEDASGKTVLVKKNIPIGSSEVDVSKLALGEYVLEFTDGVSIDRKKYSLK